jgi:hypothetical protein
VVDHQPPSVDRNMMVIPTQRHEVAELVIAAFTTGRQVMNLDPVL